jgi:hypothetical protein
VKNSKSLLGRGRRMSVRGGSRRQPLRRPLKRRLHARRPRRRLPPRRPLKRRLLLRMPLRRRLHA